MLYDKTPSQQLMKNMNQQKVLHLIYSAGSITRVELAEKTGLTQQTITNIVNRLLLDKIVVEGEPTVSSGGRKPIPLMINNANLYAIGVEVTIKHVRGVLINFQREVLEETELRIDVFRDETHTLQCITETIERLLAKLGSAQQIKGVGISVQGLVDAKQGVVLYAEKMKWRQFNLRERLERHFPFPVHVENDVNLLAIVENMDGLLEASVNNITCKLDEGIGGAVVCNKQLYAGSDHIAGEIGHYKAFHGRKARPCHCGSRGCLTTVASIGGMEEVTGLPFSRLMANVRAGDAKAIRFVKMAGEAIAGTLTNLVTFMNPDHLLLTGKIVDEAGVILVPIIREHLQKNGLFHCRSVRVVQKDRTPDGAVMAARLVIKQMFAAPVSTLSY